MGWWRRSSRLISDAFRCYNPKIVLQPRRNPIVSRHFFSSIPNSSKIYEFPSPRKNPYRHLSNRSYYRRSSYNEEPSNDLRGVALVGIGVLIILPNLETVPYTNRTQFVLSSSSSEKDRGETQFKKLKTEYEGKILPPFHPDSIRVQRIANHIIDGLKKGLKKENEEKQGKKKQGQEEKQGMKSHIEGLNWEIIVVDDPMNRAFCAPGGKIVVFTGLLNLFTEDAEVATIIGHEVGHAVARHSTEEVSETALRWFFYGWLFFFTNMKITTLLPIICVLKLFVVLPFYRRMEIEADYIGLMLMASGGYDPRVAPQAFEKFIKVVGDLELNNYISRHPSSKKRIELLGEANVMEEALNIYREVQAERGLEANFL